MRDDQTIRPVPWDRVAFGIDCYELRSSDPETLARARHTPGHHTLKVDPLEPTGTLHRYGFYYCDTLLEPVCPRERFVPFEHPRVAVDRDVPLDALLPLCHGAFVHGRFHRDPNLPREGADLRYDNWLRQLHDEGHILALLLDREPVGFVGYSGSCMVLHAVGESHRGTGWSKYLWTAACRELYSGGARELTSSVSAANLAALNLYASLGFRLRRAVDVYHAYVEC